MGLTPFEIVLPAGGLPAKIVIDGTDVSNNVSRVTVDMHASDRIPKVFLEMPGEGVLQGEGIVTQVVQVESQQDQRELMEAFLANLDPDLLESAALEKCGGLGGFRTGEAFLEVLKEYVRGDANGS